MYRKRPFVAPTTAPIPAYVKETAHMLTHAIRRSALVLSLFSLMTTAVHAANIEIGFRTTVPPIPAVGIPDISFFVVIMPPVTSVSEFAVEAKVISGEHWVSLQVGYFGAGSPDYPEIRLAYSQHCGGTNEVQYIDIGATYKGSSFYKVKILSITETPTSVTYDIEWYNRFTNAWEIDSVTAELAWGGTQELRVVNNIPVPAEQWRAATNIIGGQTPGHGWSWYTVSGQGYVWSGNPLGWTVWKQ